MQRVRWTSVGIRCEVRDPGCEAWTDKALAEVGRHSPLVEMGAGRGQWQRALTRAGADVLAFDNCSALPGRAGGHHCLPPTAAADRVAPFDIHSCLSVVLVFNSGTFLNYETCAWPVTRVW